MNARATFNRMEESTKADWGLIVPEAMKMARSLPDRVITHLQLLDGDYGGFPIDRYSHSLQTATLALKDGRDEEYVVCALLHDIGDIYAPYNHDEYAAAILRPFVREQCAWVVEKHGDFQRLYYAHHVGGNKDSRDKYRGQPYFDDCAQFCELWDQNSFDPDYKTLPLEFFRPMVEQVFARRAYDAGHVQPGLRVALVDAAIAQDRQI